MQALVNNSVVPFVQQAPTWKDVISMNIARDLTAIRDAEDALKAAQGNLLAAIGGASLLRPGTLLQALRCRTYVREAQRHLLHVKASMSDRVRAVWTGPRAQVVS